MKASKLSVIDPKNGGISESPLKFPRFSPLGEDRTKGNLMENLTIGRHGFGSICFLESICLGDLADFPCDLEELVHFGHGFVEVYPESRREPPVGRGLNRPAVVTFENVSLSQAWRLIRTHGKTKNEQTLRLGSGGWEFSRGPATFLSFNSRTKTLKFSVPSFSKYTLLTEKESSNDRGPVFLNLSFASKQGLYENSGQNAFYTADLSEIIINNGPPCSNRFLDEFRDRRRNQNEGIHRSRSTPNTSSRQVTDLQVSSSCDPFKASVGEANSRKEAACARLTRPVTRDVDELPKTSPLADDRPHDLPPLEGDEDETALTNDIQLENLDFGGRGDSAKPHGGHLTSTLSSERNGNVWKGDDLTGPEISESSLVLLDRFVPAYLKICHVQVENGHVVVDPPENASNLLSLLVEMIPDTGVGKMKYFRCSFTLFDSLHRSSGSGVTGPETGSAFVQWIASVLADRRGGSLDTDADLSQRDWADVHARVFHLLSVGKLVEAAAFAAEQDDFDLAQLISAVSNPPISQEIDLDMQNLLANNLRNGNVLVTKILLLLTGIMSTSSVSACEGMDWLTCLGMYTLFAVNPANCPSVSDILRVYEDAELNDCGWTGPFSSNSSSLSTFHPPSNLYLIIQLYLGNTDPDTLLRNLDPLFDICSHWLFSLILRALGYTFDSDVALSVSEKFAESLESAQKWDTALLVWLHTPPSDVRDDRIRNLVISGISKMNREVDMQPIEDMLVRNLLLPRDWFLEGIAARVALKP